MRARNKLLLEVKGRPMVRHVAETLLASRVDEVIAVVGHEHAAIAQALGGLPLRIVVNRVLRRRPDERRDRRHRRRSGRDRDGAGRPAGARFDIDFLIDAFMALPEPKILIAIRGGQRSNPIVLPGAEPQTLLDGGLNFGCRNLIERHPEAVAKIEVPNPHYVQDIDTAAAYATWMQTLLRRTAE